MTTHPELNLNRKPLLVFWELTKACSLACAHCRASAIPEPLADELTTSEGLALLEQVKELQLVDAADKHVSRTPILVFSGGDAMQRADLMTLLRRACELRITSAVSPAVTPKLTPAALHQFAECHVSAVSLSLDGLLHYHDQLRGVPGTFARTLACARAVSQAGLKLQINTTVTGNNIQQLPDVFAQVVRMGATAWEVFFLVATGRGGGVSEPTPDEWEAVCQFLCEASRYGIAVRTVEGPFYRRVLLQEQASPQANRQPLAQVLITRLHELLGSPTHALEYRSAGTRDGKGTVFVDYRGNVSPSGFLPLESGNIRRDTLTNIYQNGPLFRQLRDSTALKGRCSHCNYREICAGSRARAFASTNDYLESDPACAYTTK